MLTVAGDCRDGRDHLSENGIPLSLRDQLTEGDQAVTVKLRQQASSSELRTF
jgi:hypothetical protein